MECRVNCPSSNTSLGSSMNMVGLSLTHYRKKPFKMSLWLCFKCFVKPAETSLPSLAYLVSMVFVCCYRRIGRALVMVGRNPGNQAGFAVINLGIANLPATSKTDLANKYVTTQLIYRPAHLSKFIIQLITIAKAESLRRDETQPGRSYGVDPSR